MSAGNKIFVRAAACVNPFGETEIKRHEVLTAGYAAPDLKKIIKKLCGQPLRQASHLVELGVIGAQTLKHSLAKTFGESLPQETRLYSATGLGDVSKNMKLFEQVTPPLSGLAAPFDFINSSANTTAFYVAKLLGLISRNLTISRDEFSFETVLQTAVSDLTNGACHYGLVGGFDETANAACPHFLKMAKNAGVIPGQGTGWLFLTNERKAALGEITLAKLIRTDSFMDTDDWSAAITNSLVDYIDSDTPICLLPGYNISRAETETITEKLRDCQVQDYIQYSGAYFTAAAYGISRQFVSNHEHDRQYLHIMKSETGETMCVLFRVYSQ
ncbi:MAG: hypothetical protein ACC635_01090 [Acidiferrobacterales bacterium]